MAHDDIWRAVVKTIVIVASVVHDDDDGDHDHHHHVNNNNNNNNNNKMSIIVKTKTLIRPILSYGSQTWTVTTESSNALRIF
jgi:hypothetical protein